MLGLDMHQIVLLSGVPLCLMHAAASLLNLRPLRSRYFAAYSLCAACWHLEGSFVKAGLMAFVPFVKFATIPFVYWSGPLLWMYFRQLLRPERELSLRNDFLHLAPGLLACLTWIYLAGVEPETRLRFVAMDGSLSAVVLLRGLNTLGVMIAAAYLVWIAAAYIYPGRPRLSTRQKTILAAAVLIVLAALLTEIFRNLDIYWKPWLFLWSHSMLQGVLLTLRAGKPELMQQFAETIRENRQRRSRLGRHDTVQLRADLERLMTTERVFLNEDLSLGDLADYMGLNTAQLSEFINTEFGRNFNAFVNEYRLIAAEQRLVDAPKESVLDVALACGFRSMSAFQALFKARTGMSPGQWRKRQSP